MSACGCRWRLGDLEFGDLEFERFGGANQADRIVPTILTATSCSQYNGPAKLAANHYSSFIYEESSALSSDDFRQTLEVFDNPNPDRNFTIEHHAPEFTSVCPKTGQPDYGTIVFTYVPDKVCVELKSLKMYLQRFRNEGIFYEAVTNRLMDDFVAVVKPRSVTIESRWTPRGGLHSNIIVRYPDE